MVSFVEIDRHMFDLRKRDFVSRVHIFVEIERHALIFSWTSLHVHVTRENS
jgi:hypothetical protein